MLACEWLARRKILEMAAQPTSLVDFKESEVDRYSGFVKKMQEITSGSAQPQEGGGAFRKRAPVEGGSFDSI